MCSPLIVTKAWNSRDVQWAFSEKCKHPTVCKAKLGGGSSVGAWRGRGCVPGVKWPPGVAGAPRKGKVALLTGPRAGIPTCRADHPCGSQRWLRVQGGDQGRWWVVRMLGWETL